ncbi:alpha/beta hydrolase [Maribacter sp. LLG6340-A2]|uniref:alpha/beta hydrolase n=1 Tax=Maribacter sp. LLG6340-A2 TaxID=3160834 RepID=UPI00386A5DF4
MNDNIIHVYCMPGMAASAAIFEYIKLPDTQFRLYFLEWEIPAPDCTFSNYAKNMCKKITHENSVLLGVSLGGLLVQEMSKFIEVRKIIIVSSIKLTKELPGKMNFARLTGVHKILPTSLVNNVEFLAKYAFGDPVVKRLDLYKRYLSIRDKTYIDWCIDKMVHWKQDIVPDNVVHIHGDKDMVFPIAKIQDCIKVVNGTHTMIIHRAKWFNENLPTIILE